MQDSFGRTIDYLRISLTDRCNLRCIYCMPQDGVKQMSHDDIMTLEEILRAVRVAASLGVTSIRLTGGEPLVRLGIVDFVRELKRIPGIEDIALTTNAILLPRYAKDLADAGVNRLNISLDTLDPEQFHEVTRCGKLADALAGIEAAHEAGFDPIKINTVAVRHLNQDFYTFARMSVDRPFHMRFIEYMPVGTKLADDAVDNGWGPEDVITCEEIIERIDARAAEEGTEPLQEIADADKPYGRGPARYLAFPGAKGTVGFISPLSKHFCGTCNRLRLTSDGRLRPCLFGDAEFDLRTAVREGSDEDIARVFETAIGNKPDEHHDKVGTDRSMSQIGG